jgi:hypothetical protein
MPYFILQFNQRSKFVEICKNLIFVLIQINEETCARCAVNFRDRYTTLYFIPSLEVSCLVINNNGRTVRIL